MNQCYLLINPDSSINYGGDGAVDEHVHLEGLKLLQFEEITLSDLVGNIPAVYASWDDKNQCVTDIRKQ